MCGAGLPASTEPCTGPRGEERAVCACACTGTQCRHPPAGSGRLGRTAGKGMLGKQLHFRGQVGLGMKELLCWLGMLPGSTTEPAAGAGHLLCPSSGCQETGVGTKGQLGGRQSASGLVWWLYDLLFPGLHQPRGSSSPCLPPSGSCCKLQMLPSVGFRVNACCRGSPRSCPTPQRAL